MRSRRKYAWEERFENKEEGERQCSKKKSLFNNEKSHEESRKFCGWVTAEVAALVQHICLYWDGAHTDKWPSTKNMKFWNECATSVNKICNASRTGWLFGIISTNKKLNAY